MYNTNTDIWLAGAFAVVIVDFSVYPFDTLKTRIQSPNYEKLYKHADGSINRKVLFRGLYQGVGSVLLATIPSSGAFFTTYEAIKTTLSNTNTTPPLPQPLIHTIASCTGEAVSCAILTPAEVIKQNAQMIMTDTASSAKITSQTQPPKNATMQALAKFRHRPWNLWKGYTALVGRNLPFTGLHFPIFEYLRGKGLAWRAEGRRKKGEEGRQDANPVLERVLVTGLAASVSGSFASTVTTPIDVVKTRVMLAASEDADGKRTSGDGEEGQEGRKKMRRVARRGIWAMGRQIYQDEGVRGLFRGGAIRSVWSAAALSIYLGIYEGGRLYLENRRRAQDGVPYAEEIDQSGEPV
ncbi:putative mitochondrial carrier protein [Aspergillus steynii IBT 23096]|uniref:Putative mitochondrial carrier protein n=1 Tax=Aspergillus steynii IBT 23096 TaxID=1392250 RepID=A0A2I2FTG3_9EURO|nr:putative mitochondrial carrier protein [Aspergillus steynii IBT 23096]PLB43938.1 putative mitochondrial carrier protein [Aspergillus steynii IBT 23096]